MNAPLSEKEAIFRFTKIFIGQYLSSVHQFQSFQEEALNLLTVFLIRIIKGLAVKVKGILNLQGRTIPNALHLLVVVEQMGSYDFEDILKFILKSKQLKLDVKSLDVIEKLGKTLFQNDIESVNNYARETNHSNIRYIPPVYIFDLNKKSLPYRHPIDEVLPLPPEVTYQQTKQKIVKERKNIQQLAAYTKRQSRLALVGRMLDEQKSRRKQEKNRELKEDEEIEQAQQLYGVAPEKKQKFDLISYL